MELQVNNDVALQVYDVVELQVINVVQMVSGMSVGTGKILPEYEANVERIPEPDRDDFQ